MNKYDGLARIILQNVGGKGNIVAVTNCVTRLRFKLKDETKAQTDILKRTDGIVNVLKSGGLYQVVIGSHVQDVYEALIEVGHLQTLAQEAGNTAGQNQSPISAFFSVVTGVFVPILGMLCATGVIKGILMTLSFFKLINPAGGTYVILYNAADALFYFLPVLLGYTAAKKFGMSEITGLMLGLVMCVPAIANLAPNAIAVAMGTAQAPLGTFLGMNYYTSIFGIPVIMPASGNYTSSVIPIILVIWFASFFEKKIKKIVPDVIKNFGVPFVVLLVTIPLMFIIIGPIAALITEGIGNGALFIFGRYAVVGGILVGAFWQVLVIFGMHWGLVPLKLVNIANLKYDMVVTPYFAASFAQTATVIAVMLKTKDKQTKSLCIPAIISGFAGVTEPAIYGITLPRKLPFIFSCIGGGVGGAIISLAKANSYISGGLGIFGLPGFIMTQEYCELYNVPPSMNSFIWALIASVVAMVISFALTMVFYKEPEIGSFTGNKKEKTTEVENQKTDVHMVAPIKGTVKMLSEVGDEAFKSGSLGPGCAIEPDVGEVYAPCDGTITVAPDTAHAVGITSQTGAEILIHVGMNTVELKGDGFSMKVTENQKIKKGDLLITFDIEKIKKAGYSLLTPIVVGNYEEYTSVETLKNSGSKVAIGDALFDILAL